MSEGETTPMRENASPSWVTHPWVAEGQRTIRFGVSVLNPGADWSRHREWVQMAEDLGLDSYWAFDHPLGNPDCWTTLTMLAATTKKIRLGSSVSCISYRSPAMLARLAADVDRLSNGRLILGIGIGDFPQEFEQLGIPFQSTRERQQVLEEAIHVVLGLWEATSFSYQGKYFHIHEAQMRAGPVQQPRIPILIAGGGEQVTLRQVASYADVSNFGAHIWAGSAFHVEDIVRKYDVLRVHCEARERPYSSVLRSYMTHPLILAETHTLLQVKLDAAPKGLRALFQSSTIAGTPPEVIAHYQALVRAGVQYFIMSIFRQDVETLQLLTQQVMPALTKI
jgi:alkanesulfonate monooxygenase SsuD/methylene tetrahydromethanopterin reductase-like flavin-dependent oxidoreductase (luciferase family)